jgi:hypothetical protein
MLLLASFWEDIVIRKLLLFSKIGPRRSWQLDAYISSLDVSGFHWFKPFSGVGNQFSSRKIGLIPKDKSLLF